MRAGAVTHSLPALPDWQPRWRQGVLEYPVHYVRGGTSTGLVLWAPLVPETPALREALLRHLLGVPQAGSRPGNLQTSGLGRGVATSNKAFIVQGQADGSLRTTLAQLAADHPGVDWSVNCGNLSSALPLWARDVGLLPLPEGGGSASLVLDNTNTGTRSQARIRADRRGWLATTVMPGVDGAYPAVDLFLDNPVGAKTGRLLPTGVVYDEIDGKRVSCLDVAVPMVIARAADFGKTAHEPVAALAADAEFLAALQRLRVAAGLRMGLRHADGRPYSAADLARSETVPKMCIVGEPRAGGHLAVRYFTPQTVHASMAVSGGCCLAAAALQPGSVAQAVAQGLPVTGDGAAQVAVVIEHPAGLLEAVVAGVWTPQGLALQQAAYRRSAQILMRGHVPLYQASEALVQAVLACGEEVARRGARLSPAPWRETGAKQKA